jgi:GTP-binding protein
VRPVFKAEDEPKEAGPEVLFLGRSNVGKSSLINRLLGKKGLARTSSTPGRTQSVNYYRVNEEVWFVDLPGYGYARVPAKIRRTWEPMVEGFLERHRATIAMAVVLVDARHGATELDLVMKRWLEDRSIPHVVAATKSDKLSGNERTKAERALRAALAAEQQPERMVVVSSVTGLGMSELWRHVDEGLAVRSER